MSWFQSLLGALRFRTATPEFQPGTTIRVNVTGFDQEKNLGIARIGDTVLTIEGVSPEDVDQERLIEVTDFQTDDFTGHAVLTE